MDKKKFIENSNMASEVNALIATKEFAKLDSDVQRNVLDNMILSQQMEGGKLGEWLGTKLPNMSVSGAIILCCCLLLFIVISMILSKCIDTDFVLELVKIIIPVLTMTLGYIFGKRDGKEN